MRMGKKFSDTCLGSIKEAAKPQFLELYLSKISNSKTQKYSSANNYLQTMYSQILQRLSWVDQVQQFSSQIKFVVPSYYLLQQMNKLELFHSLVNSIKLLQKNQYTILQNSAQIIHALSLMTSLMQYVKIVREIARKSGNLLQDWNKIKQKEDHLTLTPKTLGQILEFIYGLVQMIVPKIIGSFNNILIHSKHQQLKLASVLMISKILELKYIDQEIVSKLELHELIIAQFELVNDNYEPYIFAMIKIIGQFYPLLSMASLDYQKNKQIVLAGYLAQKIDMFFKKQSFEEKSLLVMMINLMTAFVQNADVEIIKLKLVPSLCKLKEIFLVIQDRQIRNMVWICIRILISKFKRDQLQIKIILGEFKEMAIKLIEINDPNQLQAVNFLQSLYVSEFSRDFLQFQQFMKLTFLTPNIWIDQAYDIFNYRTVDLKPSQLCKIPQIIVAGMQRISSVLQIDCKFTKKSPQSIFLDFPRINKGIKLLGILLEQNSQEFLALFAQKFLPDFNEIINSILQILINDGNMREICLADELLFFRGIMQTFYKALQSMMQNISNPTEQEVVWIRCLKQMEEKFMNNMSIIEFQKSDISTDGREVGNWSKVSQDLIRGIELKQDKNISFFQINARTVLITKNQNYSQDEIRMIKLTSLISFTEFKNLIAQKFEVLVSDIKAIMYERKENQMKIIQNEDSFQVMILQFEKYRNQEKVDSLFIDVQVELRQEALDQGYNSKQEVKMAKDYDQLISSDQVAKIQCNYCGKLQILQQISNLQDWVCPFCQYQIENINNK